VRGAVVQDEVDGQPRIEVLVEHGQEADERRRVVVADGLGDDLPGVHIQRGDDRHGAMADVLEFATGHPARRAAASGVRAATGAYRGLLIDAHHDRSGGFVQVEVAHCSGFAEEAGVVGTGQPAAHPMGFEI
jgi:hypothetical protein